MKIKNINKEKFKNNRFKLCIGVVLTGTILGAALIGPFGESEQKQIERVPVTVNYLNTEYATEEDIISLANNRNNIIVGMSSSVRRNDTSIVPGDEYTIYSNILKGKYITVDIPEDEDGFIVNVDYANQTISVDEVGRSK